MTQSTKLRQHKPVHTFLKAFMKCILTPFLILPVSKSILNMFWLHNFITKLTLTEILKLILLKVFKKELYQIKLLQTVSACRECFYSVSAAVGGKE